MPINPSTCTATGTILREQWNNVLGNEVSSIPLQNKPDASRQISALEATGDGNIFGARIRGYICAPTSGNYIFTIAGDNGGELWLSSDDNPANKMRIAGYSGWTTFRE